MNSRLWYSKCLTVKVKEKILINLTPSYVVNYSLEMIFLWQTTFPGLSDISHLLLPHAYIIKTRKKMPPLDSTLNYVG